MLQVVDGDLLDLQHIVGVEDRFKVLRSQERLLELVQTVVVRISLVELLLLNGLQHFQNCLLGVCWLLVQDVGHQFLREDKTI